MSDLLSTDINDYCFIDTETKALPWTAGTTDEDVTLCGAYRYSECARVIMVQYAIGLNLPRVVAFPDFDVTRRFVWGLMPEDLRLFYENAQQGECWFAGWNTAFDRLMLSTIPGCTIKPRMAIDVGAQAAASNLPPKLGDAARILGVSRKQENGKQLIKLFTGADGWHRGDLIGSDLKDDSDDWVGNFGATPETNPDEWAQFKSYGGQDIVATRDVFQHTRQLPRREWEEYWANERINDRGMKIDAPFAARCAAIAEANRVRMDLRMREITGGKITAATQAKRIGEWLFENCKPSEARDALVRAWVPEDEVTDDDHELIPSKLSVAEDRLNAYINYFENLDEQWGLTDAEADLLDIAEARRAGASATPAKFQKALDHSSRDGRLRGQFRFNGAKQTGRYSSLGVQVHNLVRASLTDKEHPTREVDVIEFINSLEIEDDYA